MNRVCNFASGAMLSFALILAVASATPASAQQAMESQSSAKANPQAIDDHVKLLTQKLDLTSDQQTKAKTILEELLTTTETIQQDESMSRAERKDYAKAAHYKADRKLREIVNDDQKKKLDQFEEEFHFESAR